jgi:hypothetical protein
VEVTTLLEETVLDKTTVEVIVEVEVEVPSVDDTVTVAGLEGIVTDVLNVIVTVAVTVGVGENVLLSNELDEDERDEVVSVAVELVIPSCPSTKQSKLEIKRITAT